MRVVVQIETHTFVVLQPRDTGVVAELYAVELETHANVAVGDVRCSGLHVGLARSNPIQVFDNSPRQPWYLRWR